MMKYIQINDSNRDIILELFNKTTDKKGFIIDKASKKWEICPYSKKNIHYSNFSILPGTYTFVNNKDFCFAEHITCH